MLWTNEERTSAGEGGVEELRDNGMESVRGTSESEAERGGGGVSRRTELGELEKREEPTKKESYLMSRDEDLKADTFDCLMLLELQNRLKHVGQEIFDKWSRGTTLLLN